MTLISASNQGRSEAYRRLLLVSKFGLTVVVGLHVFFAAGLLAVLSLRSSLGSFVWVALIIGFGVGSPAVTVYYNSIVIRLLRKISLAEALLIYRQGRFEKLQNSSFLNSDCWRGSLFKLDDDDLEFALNLFLGPIWRRIREFSRGSKPRVEQIYFLLQTLQNELQSISETSSQRSSSVLLLSRVEAALPEWRRALDRLKTHSP